MTKIKLCGLSRACDIQYANELLPEYIGFVFWQKSRRYVPENTAAELRSKLDSRIKAVGVFVDENPKTVADLLDRGIIDIAQLHGREDDEYIRRLRGLTDKLIFKAFSVKSQSDIEAAEKSAADMVLLDCGMGGGEVFDWELAKRIQRPYLLAGGLDCENVRSAIARLKPWGVDVSSGIETDGLKDAVKMREFVRLIMEADLIERKETK